MRRRLSKPHTLPASSLRPVPVQPSVHLNGSTSTLGRVAQTHHIRYVRPLSTTPFPSLKSQLPINGNVSLPIACRYTPRSNLTLQFTPEEGVRALPLEVTVIKAFTPFTISQTLLVQTLRIDAVIPSQFILKLLDPRFTTPDIDHGYGRTIPWTAAVDENFKAGLRNVRSGVWKNYWQRLGGVKTRDSARPDSAREGEFGDWSIEMDRWEDVVFTYDQEVSAYRALRSLQGRHIPRFYGTCRLIVGDGSSDLDPLIANVDGLIIEHIDGTPMDKFTILSDITETDAERVSQGVLNTVRRIRDLKVVYDDIAARNIIVRRDDLDHPVLIDFGSVKVKPSDCTDDEWVGFVSGCGEVKDARRLLEGLGWHNPSPWRDYHESCSDLIGYTMSNARVEKMRPDWRDQKFERVSDVPPDVIVLDKEGKGWRWEYLRWRIKPGVKTSDADWYWGR
ncbi:hypothetical protein EW146_g6133 [Bondarzewia mesenterica]|uniref:Protein kinase domain-containing protein n=1 Tax=Bondarzewia mesenterica TaxID=1095465 RepID=A0A4S4LPK5_9AGAM|nr:hypothetical protein EW146_g6133 [Bondarzewia mesenterica]